MKLISLTLAVLLVVGSCVSSSKNEEEEEALPDEVELQQPGDQPNQPAKVYIDSVKKITRNQKKVLLINGTFPDACTHLQNIEHRIQNKTLHLELSAWRNPEMMCAQVLTSFSVVYNRLSSQEIATIEKVLINNTAFSF